MRFRIKRYFLPPGSPQLNPVEILATYLKSRLFTVKHQITDCTTLKEKIKEEMEKIASVETNRFFCEFRRWFLKALNNEPF
jgi:transposase